MNHAELKMMLDRLDNTVLGQKHTCLYLVTLPHNGNPKEVDSVHVEGDRDDVQGQGGVSHTGYGAGTG